MFSQHSGALGEHSIAPPLWSIQTLFVLTSQRDIESITVYLYLFFALKIIFFCRQSEEKRPALL